MGASYFTPKTFSFLRGLAANNDRDWFQAHREEYEEHVREPALRFIAALDEPFRAISPHILIKPTKVGGSLVRIQRDTRFSPDKTPYREYLGIGLRHEMHEEAPTPRFYLAIQPRGSYLGVGMWRPDARAAQAIRQAIAEQPDTWRQLTTGDGFAAHFTLVGDSLKRPPRGFASDHPLVGDLQRKDFAASTNFTQKQITSDGFLDLYLDRCRRAAPLAAFLSDAVGVPF